MEVGSVMSLVDKAKVECLNEDARHPYRLLLLEDDDEEEEEKEKEEEEGKEGNRKKNAEEAKKKQEKIANVPHDNEGSYLASSDDDPQLLLKIGFRRPVRLSLLHIKAPAGSVRAGQAPRLLKLFINDLSMGFSDAESATPVQEVTLEEEKIERGCIVPLRFVKFSNVSSIILFVESPNGEGPTKIQKLDLLGVPTESMEMKEWKPVKENERLAPSDT